MLTPVDSSKNIFIASNKTPVVNVLEPQLVEITELRHDLAHFLSRVDFVLFCLDRVSESRRSLAFPSNLFNLRSAAINRSEQQ